MATRVLVVDDAVLFRRVVTEALAGIPGVVVSGSAANGRLALSRLAALSPDLMTLDIEMPEMNGIEVLEEMRRARSPAGVIVLSSLTARGGAMTVRALELGAFDFVTKPEGSDPDANLADLRSRMLPIIRAYERRKEIRQILERGADCAPSSGSWLAARLPSLATTVDGPDSSRLGTSRLSSSGPSQARHEATSRRQSKATLVLIGVSTGGPAALAEVLPALPAEIPAPVFVVQHMPAHFTSALAASLQAKCKVRVKEALDGEIARNGCVYIAPGGRQMKLHLGEAGEIQIQIRDDAPENNCRPSVDYLFRSAALQFPGRAVAAILTGMGSDGAQGVKMLKRGGSFCIAQDEATCVVYGMPREAVLTGAVDLVSPLDGIAKAILAAVAGTER